MSEDEQEKETDCSWINNLSKDFIRLVQKIEEHCQGQWADYCWLLNDLSYFDCPYADPEEDDGLFFAIGLYDVEEAVENGLSAELAQKISELDFNGWDMTCLVSNLAEIGFFNHDEIELLKQEASDWLAYWNQWSLSGGKHHEGR